MRTAAAVAPATTTVPTTTTTVPTIPIVLQLLTSHLRCSKTSMLMKRADPSDYSGNPGRTSL